MLTLIDNKVLRTAVPPKLFDLRWRLDFIDGRVMRGTWNGAGKLSLWNINKKGLLRASIEAQDVTSYEITTLYECDGHEYAFAQWEAYAKIRGMFSDTPVKQLSRLAGLTFYTNNKRTTVYINGQVVQTDTTEQHKQFNFKEHSV